MATGRVPTTANSPLTAKGDVFTYSTAPARLAVGSDGDTLVADSAATTGLRWQGNYSAGKNKIINGDFNIWQRGTTFNSITSSTYTADRWRGLFINGTINMTRQSFTAGTAPVAGYESAFFSRWDRTSTAATADYWGQKIEDVRTFAGQTVTISFWAKASANTTLDYYFDQDFGSGGSAGVSTSILSASLTTSWQRFSGQIAIASISGKTIGTSSSLVFNYRLQTAEGNKTIDIWGVQIEAGSVATAFQTATGTIQGELAACRRYLPVVINNNANYSEIALGYAYGTNTVYYHIYFDVPARVAPTGITVSGTFNGYAANTSYSFSPSFNGGNSYGGSFLATSGVTITSGQGSRCTLSSNGYILFTGCEL